MANFVKFSNFIENLGKKVFNLNTDTLKIALTNTAPTAASDNQLSDITQVANGNGYTTGGTAMAGVGYTESAGTGTLIGDAVTFTATGAMGPFRYAVLYSDTATNDELIAYVDYGSNLTLADGDVFVVKPGGEDTGGTILTIA
jgi:hypothetical protein